MSKDVLSPAELEVAAKAFDHVLEAASDSAALAPMSAHDLRRHVAKAILAEAFGRDADESDLKAAGMRALIHSVVDAAGGTGPRARP